MIAVTIFNRVLHNAVNYMSIVLKEIPRTPSSCKPATLHLLRSNSHHLPPLPLPPQTPAAATVPSVL